MNNFFKLLYKCSNKKVNPKPTKCASVILCRPSLQRNSAYNYQILFLKKQSNMSFGNMMVFPGGKYELQDENLAKLCGFPDWKKATALRETFQQTGLYFLLNEITRKEQSAFLEEIKYKYNRQNSNQQPLDMCEIYSQLVISKQIIQDPNLIHFIRLVTIPYLRQRYDTFFYIKLIDPRKTVNFPILMEKGLQNIHDTDTIKFQQKQFTECEWMTPIQALKCYYHKKNIQLAPPQLIILNILSSFKNFKELEDYLNHQNQNQKNLKESPNVISLVPNQQIATKNEYPYAATLIGDYEFPFKNIKQIQRCENMQQELTKYQSLIKDIGFNRFLFKKSKDFFKDQFDIKCSLNDSILKKMIGQKQLMIRLNS